MIKEEDVSKIVKPYCPNLRGSIGELNLDYVLYRVSCLYLTPACGVFQCMYVQIALANSIIMYGVCE